MDFKRGDRVRLTNIEEMAGTGEDVSIGMKGTVLDEQPEDFFPESSIAVDLDGIPRHHGGGGEGWWFHPKNLELVKD